MDDPRLATLDAAVIEAAEKWRDRLAQDGFVWPLMNALDAAVDVRRATTP